MPKNYETPPAWKVRASTRRGSTSGRATLARVEGEILTIDQISERLSCSVTAAQSAIRRVRRRQQPLTWAALRTALASP